MRKLVAVALLAALLLAAPGTPRPGVAAEAVLESALAGDEPALAEGYCWLETYGIGVRLAPVAVVDSAFPRLLAADPSGDAKLYQLGPGGGAELLDKIKGAKGFSVERAQFSPRIPAGSVGGRETLMGLESGGEATQLEWEHAGRYFAVLVRGPDRASLARRRDEVMGGMVLLPCAEGAIAPLVCGGQYACVLPGWTRSGTRFFRKSGAQWLALRFFHIPAPAFENLGALQLAVEEQLTRAAFRRSDGAREKFGGEDAFLGEYFGGSEGFVQRLWFARLQGGYLVALLQAPEALRAELAAAARALAPTVQRVDLQAQPAGETDFAQARVMRALAWQEGRAVRWGALFDDARGGPVLWRQRGIAWSVRLLSDGREIAAQAGAADGSRDLNPLSGTGEVSLPDGVTGAVDVVLRVGGMGAATRISVR